MSTSIPDLSLLPPIDGPDDIASLPRPASTTPSTHSQHPSGSHPSHTRTQSDDSVPHATKKTMADHLRKYEGLFTLTPQRMRIIVDSFVETLDLGLKEYGQVVVRYFPYPNI